MNFIHIFEPISIKGPSHLLQVLSNEPNNFNFWEHTELIAWLDKDRRLVGISNAETLQNLPFAIALKISKNESLEGSASELNLPAETHLLDQLVLSRSAWRSFLCNDDNCCPIVGRPWPVDVTKPGQTEFEELISLSEREGFLGPAAQQYLNNLQIRDAWLVYVVSNPTQLDTKVNRWAQIIRATNGLADSPVLLTLLSVLTYLQNETESAKKLVQQALELDEDYNLARLISRALKESAPIELIIESFRAVTYERLNLSPPTAA